MSNGPGQPRTADDNTMTNISFGFGGIEQGVCFPKEGSAYLHDKAYYGRLPDNDDDGLAGL